jgi:uncharacterized protein
MTTVSSNRFTYSGAGEHDVESDKQVQLFLRSGGERLDAVLLPTPDAPAVLFCHGFPGVYQHTDLADAVHRAGLTVLRLKYRGVGQSTGFFDFRGAIADVEAALDYLTVSGIGSRGIGLFGYSAGAYYGINAAISRNSVSPSGSAVNAVCLLSPVVDLPQSALQKFENMYDLMLSAPDSIRIAGIDHLVATFAEVWRDHHVLDRVAMLDGTPMLIIEGDDEEQGNLKQARMLYAAAREPKRLLILPGAGHYFERQHDRAQLGQEIASFFARELMGLPS